MYVCMYVCRLGSEVTVVEFLDSITPGIDKELASNFLKASNHRHHSKLYVRMYVCMYGGTTRF